MAAGRDPSVLGMEGQVTWSGDRDRMAKELAAWAAGGASHVAVNTMGAGLATVDEHLAVLESVAEDNDRQVRNAVAAALRGVAE